MTTTSLKTPRARWYDLPVPVTIALCVCGLIAIAALFGRIHTAQQAAAVPTPALPAPIIILASPLPHIPPTAVPPVQVAAVPVGNVTQRAIVVYGDHDLATAIGAVEAGRSFAPVARWGAEWVQVDMSGSGRVFVRTADLYGVPELVDLQPAPAPVVIDRPVYLASQAAPVEQAAPTYQVTNDAPAPTLLPQQAAIYDRQVWAQQRAGR